VAPSIPEKGTGAKTGIRTQCPPGYSRGGIFHLRSDYCGPLNTQNCRSGCGFHPDIINHKSYFIRQNNHKGNIFVAVEFGPQPKSHGVNQFWAVCCVKGLAVSGYLFLFDLHTFGKQWRKNKPFQYAAIDVFVFVR